MESSANDSGDIPGTDDSVLSRASFVAAIEGDWIGLLFVIVLLSSVLSVFLPKVRQADNASGQSRATWQAAFAIFVGTIVIVAVRWSIWSNQIPPLM